MRLALVFFACATPALAGVTEAVEDHALPATSAFAESAAELAQTAEGDCTPGALQPAYQDTFDAWLGMSHLTLGPVEEDGRKLAIAFWPDKRGMVASTVSGLLADEDPIAEDPDAFGDVSVAGRGLFALERLLYGDAAPDYAEGDYACTLARAMALDLDRMADEIAQEWREDFAGTLLTAGDAGNDTYLSEKEAAQALYTALASGLEFVADQRIGQPLGTFDRPRPERAEARRSDRPKRNVRLSLEALRAYARSLAPGPIPETEAAFAEALDSLDALDPVFAGIDDPTGRLKLEVVQQRVRDIRTVAASEIGVPLGVSAGFNSADGD